MGLFDGMDAYVREASRAKSLQTRSSRPREDNLFCNNIASWIKLPAAHYPSVYQIDSSEDGCYEVERETCALGLH